MSSARYTATYPDGVVSTICSTSSEGESGHSPSKRTQVPQLLLRSRGTGINTAGQPAPSHSFLKRIAPKWEKNVAMYVTL